MFKLFNKMSDYYMYTVLELEYDSLFDPEQKCIKEEGFSLAYNQELPEDRKFPIIRNGKWVNDELKTIYRKHVSPIFTPKEAIVHQIVRLHKIN